MSANDRATGPPNIPVGELLNMVVTVCDHACLIANMLNTPARGNEDDAPTLDHVMVSFDLVIMAFLRLGYRQGTQPHWHRRTFATPNGLNPQLRWYKQYPDSDSDSDIVF